MKRRKVYLDMVKIAGAVAIIALHTMSNAMNYGNRWFPPSYITVKHTLHQFLYTAVPVFILATGAGFLSGERDNSFQSMKRPILKTVVCIVFFGFCFSLIKMLVNGEPISPGALCVRILTGNTWSHMWYLYRLLGIYLCIPVLSAFMRHSGIKEQLVFAGSLLFFSSVYPYAAGKLGFIPATVMPVSGTWLFYVMMGGILGRLPDRLNGMLRLLPIPGILLGGCAIFCKSLRDTADMLIDETHPYQILFAVSLFAGIKILCGARASFPLAECLARDALGIYVIHPVFIHLCVRGIRFNPWDHMPALSLPLVVLLIYLCSAAVVEVSRRLWETLSRSRKRIV